MRVVAMAMLAAVLLPVDRVGAAIDRSFEGDRHLRFEVEDRSYATESPGDAIVWPEAFTLEAWVRLTTASPYGLIAGRPMAERGQDPFYHVALAFEGPDGRTPALIASTGVAGTYRVAAASSAIDVQRWVHVAGVRDVAGTLRVYVDGVLAGTSQSVGAVSPNPGMRFSIGGGMRGDGLEHACCSGNFAVRDVKLWRRALTAGEVSSSAAGTLVDLDLVRHWPLSEGRGRTLYSALAGRAPLTAMRTRWVEEPFLSPAFRRSVGPASIPTQSVFGLWPIRIGGQTHFVVTGIATPTFPETRTVVSVLSPQSGALVDSTTARLVAPASSVHVVDAVNADFDADGREDILLVDSGTDTSPFPGGVAQLFMQQSDGRLRDETAARLPQGVRYYVSGDARDFDGDGDLDLFLCALSNPTNTLSSALLLNDGAGRFADAGLGTLPPDMESRERVCQQAHVVDADGDGDSDLIVSLRGGAVEDRPDENRDRVLLNDGRGRFSFMPVDALPPRAITPKTDMMAYATGDFDGDGDEDVAVSGSLQTYDDRVAVQIYRNIGGGRFEDASTHLFNDWPDNHYIFKLDAIDFDRDGRMDLLARGNNGYRPNPADDVRIELLLNRGDQWVPMSTRLGLDFQITGPSTFPIDADGDGDLDLAFATGVEAGYMLNERPLPAVLPRPAFALQDGRPMTLRLSAGESHERLFFDVPAGATALRVQSTSAQNVDLYVSRRPFADTPEVVAAPARGAAVAVATTPLGDEDVVVSGTNLSPGRWYVTPVNADAAIAQATLTATITQSQAVPALAAGHFYNPRRGGHGVSYEYVAGQRVLVWYTYLDDGTPIWYYAQGAAPSPNRGAWSATMRRFHWHGAGTTSRPVGTASVVEIGKGSDGADRIVFSWNLNGDAGSETMQRLGGTGCPAGFEGNNGMWFAPTLSGYGYTVTYFPNYEFMPVYLYDAKGNPRWVTGERAGFSPADATIPLFQPSGFCPWCVRPAGQSLPSQSAGALTRRFSGGRISGLGLNVSLASPVVGAWMQDRPVSLLTDPSPCVVP